MGPQPRVTILREAVAEIEDRVQFKQGFNFERWENRRGSRA